MGDPLSVTASVIALVGVAGNILEGCLFLKDFAKNAKNAPNYILALAEELNTLEAAIKSFKNLVLVSWHNGYIISVDDYMPVLKQCLEIVDDLGRKIEGDIKAFKEGTGGLWDKLRTAGKKGVWMSNGDAWIWL
jgi:hypothetical protein